MLSIEWKELDVEDCLCSVMVLAVKPELCLSMTRLQLNGDLESPKMLQLCEVQQFRAFNN